ncbi:MAG: hypothetical protein QOD26_145 [Betaproteobacteria bacterium]|jgi:predicted Zn finger-like uncharacterized protein|nr:hypothetical protein [Betaproteobacteria bacterium]
MSLATRCPVCGTAFRVVREQLAARGGRVRCGKCATVFDGVASLVEEGGEKLSLDPSPQMGLFDPSRRGPQPPEDDPEEVFLPAFMAEAEPPRRHFWLWALAALLAAVGLAAQAAYRYRAELAVLGPGVRGPLEATCRLLRCQVSLPRRTELLSIESSDLQADNRRDGIIVLNAVLRNRAPFPQEYPALELTLTDEGDRPLLRRVLTPRDYLDPVRATQLVPAGIGPGGEAALRVFLDASRTRATGYRLYLFYPA